MKLSPFFKILAFVALLVLVLGLAQPAPTAIYTSRAVQIPIDLKLAFNGFVLFLVTFGLQFIFDKLKVDLRGWNLAIAMEVSEFLILQMQGLINVIPAQYDFWVSLGLYVLLAILSAVGFANVALRRGLAMSLLE